MKTTLLLVFLVSISLTSAGFADEVELAGKMDNDHIGRAEGGAGHGGFCRLNLTDEQKAKMRAEHFKFAEARIDLEAQLKHSRLELRKVMSDPKADYKAAKVAAEEVAKDQAKLFSSKQAFHAEMAFKILTPEQRAQSIKCHPFGHRRHHGYREFASWGKARAWKQGRGPKSEGSESTPVME